MGENVFQRICLFAFYALSFLSSSAQDLPIDKNATRETVALYRHLLTIGNKGYLFGHQDDLAYGFDWKYQDGRSDIHDVTGDYPALYGWELGRIELDHAVNLDSVPFDKMRSFIREGYERGGVITISWHLNNPLTGATAWQPAPGTVASILPGAQKNALYKTWLDKVAAFLQSLKDSHGRPIPVILRLFHEINGSWFWWGGKNCTPDELKQLWHFTVAYLRDEKGLHQLLYAYNTDRFATRDAYLEKYPGDEWVDIAGFDIYQRGGNTPFLNELKKTLTLLEEIAAEKHKIPALTEFGYNGLPDSTWWTNVLAPALQEHHLAYVMAWRNAGRKGQGQPEFYVPYEGQASASDFVQFYKDNKTLFQKDIAGGKLYRQN